MRQANRILESAAELRKIADNPEHPLSLSIGIAVSAPTSILSLDALMDRADKALYDVKEQGKSGVSINQSTINQSTKAV